MHLNDAIRFALQAIIAHRLRSFLTLLGIAVGIAAVILLTSIGEGVHRYVLSEFSQFGTNIVVVTPGKTKTGGVNPTGFPSTVRPLTLDDAAVLKRLPLIMGVTPAVWGNSEVESHGRTRRSTVYGIGADFLDVFSSTISIGRFLPDDDGNNARAFVVLGAKLRTELFGSRNPLGEKVRIGGLQFRVIGIMAPKGQFLGIDLDDTAFIPAARALELYNREGLMEIDIAYQPAANSGDIAAAVKSRLIARHGREDFTIITQEDMLATLSNILNILTAAVAALGSISLLVGGVGIVTIMTISVAERMSEIGLLVAIGARRSTILLLFLGESVVLAMMGGVLGLALGIGIAQTLKFLLPHMPIHTPWEFALAAEITAAVIGLLAGVMPARRAARMNAVDALRSE